MPAGRPLTYHFKAGVQLKQIYKFMLMGATIQELADFLEVHKDTVYDWIEKYPEFSDTIKKGRLQADAEVSHKTFKKATGYTKKMVKIFHYQGSVIEHPYKEYFEPDSRAQQFWLTNRQPDKWKMTPGKEKEELERPAVANIILGIPGLDQVESKKAS